MRDPWESTGDDRIVVPISDTLAYVCSRIPGSSTHHSDRIEIMYCRIGADDRYIPLKGLWLPSDALIQIVSHYCAGVSVRHPDSATE